MSHDAPTERPRRTLLAAGTRPSRSRAVSRAARAARNRGAGRRRRADGRGDRRRAAARHVGLEHIGTVVPDVTRAARFYSSVFNPELHKERDRRCATT